MELSEFTLKILLLFIPGVISFMFIETLTSHKDIKTFRFVLNCLVLGFICYLCLYPVYFAWNNIFIKDFKVDFFKALINEKVYLDGGEIIHATLVAIFVGILTTWLINARILFRIANFLKVSKKHGEIDIWSYIMNSNLGKDGWVVIRDKERDRIYEGWVQLYSDTTETNELFLRDVKVYYNSTGKLIYETPALYVPSEIKGLTIEFPKLPYSKMWKEKTENVK